MAEDNKPVIVDAAAETASEYIQYYALPKSPNAIPNHQKGLGYTNFENIEAVNAREGEFLKSMVGGTTLVRGDSVPLDFIYYKQQYKAEETKALTTLLQDSYLYRAENEDIIKVYVNQDAELVHIPPTLAELERMSAADGLPINVAQIPEPEIEEISAPNPELDALVAQAEMEAEAAEEITQIPETASAEPPVTPITEAASKPSVPANTIDLKSFLRGSISSPPPQIQATQSMPDTTAVEAPEENPIGVNSPSYDMLQSVYQRDGFSKAELDNLKEFAGLIEKQDAGSELTAQELAKFSEYQQEASLALRATNVNSELQRNNGLEPSQ